MTTKYKTAPLCGGDFYSCSLINPPTPPPSLCYPNEMDIKVAINVFIFALTIVGYTPYIIDIFKGKTKPHALTWFTVSTTAFIAYALQVEGGAGVGAWSMLFVSVLCVLIFLLSLKYGTRDIKKVDIFFLFVSLAALYLWLKIEQPVLSILLITTAEVLAYFPTIRKSWNDPHSETLVFYEISTIRHSLVLLAVEKLNLLTALYPAAWALTNLTISLILINRRKRLFK